MRAVTIVWKLREKLITIDVLCCIMYDSFAVHSDTHTHV